MSREILRLRMLAIENRVAALQVWPRHAPVGGLKVFVAAVWTALTTGYARLPAEQVPKCVP